MGKGAPGAHFSQYLICLVMVGPVKVSVHCCVCADESTEITSRLILRIIRLKRVELYEYGILLYT